jgi:hypothetical protein
LVAAGEGAVVAVDGEAVGDGIYPWRLRCVY